MAMVQINNLGSVCECIPKHEYISSPMQNNKNTLPLALGADSILRKSRGSHRSPQIPLPTFKISTHISSHFLFGKATHNKKYYLTKQQAPVVPCNSSKITKTIGHFTNRWRSKSFLVVYLKKQEPLQKAHTFTQLRRLIYL